MGDTQAIDEAGIDESDPFEEFSRAMGADGDATPFPDFIRLRAEAAVHAEGLGLSVEGDEAGDGSGLQVFTAYSYEAVQTVLGDGELFSSSGYSELMGIVLGRTILEMDEPVHRAYRSILSQAFTKAEMDRWEVELVAPLVNRMIDEFADRGAADLVREVLFAFPVRVIAELLGLPEADLAQFHRLAVEVIGVTVDWDRAVASSARLREYFQPIVADRRLHPQHDMISVLANAETDGQRLTDEEIYSFLRLLLPAGAETTYRSSSNLLYGLLTHTDQLNALRDDRTLMAQAIEEGIRWEPPLLIIFRTATRDTTVCGVEIPEGSTVICNMGSANHDEQRWENAEEFDIFRPRRPHIGFAHGPHICLGMHLARMETRVALNAIFDRLPNLRLDPAVDDHFIAGQLFRSPPRLHVVWDT